MNNNQINHSINYNNNPHNFNSGLNNNQIDLEYNNNENTLIDICTRLKNINGAIDNTTISNEQNTRLNNFIDFMFDINKLKQIIVGNNNHTDLSRTYQLLCNINKTLDNSYIQNYIILYGIKEYVNKSSNISISTFRKKFLSDSNWRININKPKE